MARDEEPGDKIFLFGFSRGAYAMRILARLISRCGVINCNPGGGGPETNLDDAQLSTRVGKAYEVLRKHHFRRLERKPESADGAMVELRQWLDEKGQGDPLHEHVPVEFLGLWDTVSAIGLRFIESVCRSYRDLQNVNDKLYDSRAGLATYFRYKPRDIARICREKGQGGRRVTVPVGKGEKKGRCGGAHRPQGSGYPTDSLQPRPPTVSWLRVESPLVRAAWSKPARSFELS